MMMNKWIDRLESTPQNIERGGHHLPTKPTKPVFKPQNDSFVSSVGWGSGPFVIFHGPIRTGSDAPETKNLESIFESSTIKSPWHVEPAATKYPGWLIATNLETGSIVEWKKGTGDRIDGWTSATIPESIGGTYRVSTRMDGLCRTIVKLKE